MDHRADVDHPILDVLAERWSPSGFAPRPVTPADLRSLFEAARWAPSSFNEQPWRYLLATRDDEEEFARLLSCLVPANQEWARNASVLVLTVAKQTFTRNGKPNRVAQHDIGLASAQLTVEAASRGLFVHQMAGIEPDRARELYGIPDDHEPVTALAIGHRADPESLTESLRTRDSAPRTRRPQSEFVFTGTWERPADLG